MASLLLLLSLTATTSSVFASDYALEFPCDGYEDNAPGYRLCDIKIPGVRADEVDYYYELVLIRDDSYLNNDRCEEYKYRLVTYNNTAAVRVSSTCVGYFGLKRRNKDYPYQGGCGQDNLRGFKIINGFKAKECQFPWMAFVRLNWVSKKTTGNCGGSIISDKWVLTAAHCIVKQGWNGIIPPVNAITAETGGLLKIGSKIIRKVKSIVLHPNYDYKRLKYDIALLELNETIKWDGCHVPVCLNKDLTPEKSTSFNCRVSGWGRISQRPVRGSNDLLWAHERILSRSKCDAIYGSHSNDYTLCGRATSNNKRGFCYGDSGGPMVCKSKGDGRFYLHGVVSAYYSGNACRMEGLYSSVQAFHSWIKKTMDSS